jgi:hypothetical protein
LDQHHRLGKYAPIKQLPLKDAWIQIIHGSNLANRVRGVRAASQTIERENLPPRLAERIRPVPPGEFIIDNTFGLFIRYSESFFQWIKVRFHESNI